MHCLWISSKKLGGTHMSLLAIAWVELSRSRICRDQVFQLGSRKNCTVVFQLKTLNFNWAPCCWFVECGKEMYQNLYYTKLLYCFLNPIVLCHFYCHHNNCCRCLSYLVPKYHYNLSVSKAGLKCVLFAGEGSLESAWLHGMLSTEGKELPLIFLSLMCLTAIHPRLLY